MKDPELKKRFIELRAIGHSFIKISYELNVAKSTLIEWSKENNIQISNMRTIESEVLQEKYYVMKHHRITLLGQHLEGVRVELSKRDLATIPTEKLFDLLGKLTNALKQEETPLVFKRNESRYSHEFDEKVAEWRVKNTTKTRTILSFLPHLLT